MFEPFATPNRSQHDPHESTTIGAVNGNHSDNSEIEESTNLLFNDVNRGGGGDSPGSPIAFDFDTLFADMSPEDDDLTTASSCSPPPSSQMLMVASSSVMKASVAAVGPNCRKLNFEAAEVQKVRKKIICWFYMFSSLFLFFENKTFGLAFKRQRETELLY